MNKKFYALNSLLFNTLFLFAANRMTEHAVIPVVQPRKISLRLFTKETRGLGKKAKQLYGQAMTYDNEPRRLNQSLPIAHKIAFEDALNYGLHDVAGALMQKHSHLRIKHPIGRALWDIWKNNASVFDLDKREFRIIPAANVFFIAKELAIEARNKDFLESYLLTLQSDLEIRKIVFPYHYNVENFNTILFVYAQTIYRHGIDIDIIALLAGIDQ